MNRVLIMGDTNGSWYPILDAFNSKGLKDESDTMIVLGNLGANYYLDEKDVVFKEKLQSIGCEFFIIRGNHEERPGNIMKKNPSEWYISDFFGGKTYVEKKYSHIHYAMDDISEYEIHGYRTLVIPGAYSEDKFIRLDRGYKWFKDEQLKKREMKAGRKFMSKEYDLILSHTCPTAFEHEIEFPEDVDQTMVDKSMGIYLDEFESKTKYRLWLFGHFHMNREYSSGHQMCLYDQAIDIDQKMKQLE